MHLINAISDQSWHVNSCTVFYNIKYDFKQCVCGMALNNMCAVQLIKIMNDDDVELSDKYNSATPYKNSYWASQK